MKHAVTGVRVFVSVSVCDRQKIRVDLFETARSIMTLSFICFFKLLNFVFFCFGCEVFFLETNCIRLLCCRRNLSVSDASEIHLIRMLFVGDDVVFRLLLVSKLIRGRLLTIAFLQLFFITSFRFVRSLKVKRIDDNLQLQGGLFNSFVVFYCIAMCIHVRSIDSMFSSLPSTTLTNTTSIVQCHCFKSTKNSMAFDGNETISHAKCQKMFAFGGFFCVCFCFVNTSKEFETLGDRKNFLFKAKIEI